MMSGTRVLLPPPKAITNAYKNSSNMLSRTITAVIWIVNPDFQGPCFDELSSELFSDLTRGGMPIKPRLGHTLHFIVVADDFE